MKKCKVIAIANQKGGVGKTTTTINLAMGLKNQGYSVLAIDLDAQSNLTTCFGIDGDTQSETIEKILLKNSQDAEIENEYGIIYLKNGIDVIPSSIRLAEIEMQLITATRREYLLSDYLDTIKENYDYILVDCSPSLSILTINAFTAADSVLIPALAQHLSAIGLTQLIKTILQTKRKLNKNLQIEGILLTMFSERTKLAKEMKKEIKEAYGDYIELLDITIPQCVKCAEAGIEGKSVIEYAPKASAAIAYTSLAKYIAGGDEE